MNKNKLFAINFPSAETPILTINITLDNQNLTVTESNNFLGTHLDTNLSWTLHGKIIEETEYCMGFGEEFILLSESRLIKESLFAHFQSLLEFEILFWSSPSNSLKAILKK